MRNAFASVLLMSAAGSAAYGLFKLLSLLGGRRLSQGWRYRGLLLVGALFVLPLHRLWRLVPRPRAVSGIVRAARAAGLYGAAGGTGVAAALGRSVRFAAAVWLATALCLAARALFRLLRAKRLLESSAVEADQRLCRIAAQEALRAGVRAAPRLLESPLVRSPMLTGFLRPTVMLPEGEWSDENLRLILSHELAHFRRGDLWKKLFFALLRCFHWFNPLVCLLSRDFSYRMETACDERVVSAMDRVGRKSYGYLLIDCAPNVRQEAAGAFVAFASSRAKLERRIETMMESKKRSHVIFGLLLALILAVGCVATTALAAGADAQPVKVIDCTNAEAVATGDISEITLRAGDGKTANVWYDTATGEPLDAVTYEVSGGCFADAEAEAIKVKLTYLEQDTMEMSTAEVDGFVASFDAE